MKETAGCFLITVGINGRKIANQESIDGHTIHNHSICIAWSCTAASSAAGKTWLLGGWERSLEEIG